MEEILHRVVLYLNVYSFEGYGIHMYGIKISDSKLVKSFKKIKILIIIDGVQATVTKYVVEYDIPFCLSKEAMKKAKT